MRESRIQFKFNYRKRRLSNAGYPSLGVSKVEYTAPKLRSDHLEIRYAGSGERKRWWLKVQ